MTNKWKAVAAGLTLAIGLSIPAMAEEHHDRDHHRVEWRDHDHDRDRRDRWYGHNDRAYRGYGYYGTPYYGNPYYGYQNYRPYYYHRDHDHDRDWR